MWLTIYHHPVPLSRNLGTLTSWNPLGLPRPVMGLLYLFFYQALTFRRLMSTTVDPYRGRTASLTSKRCILYIYSTNIGTEYFKHGVYSPFFFLLKMQFVS